MPEKKRFTNRKIARSMARHNMKRAGMRRINRVVKHDKPYKSPFQMYWRDYVLPRGVLG